MRSTGNTILIAGATSGIGLGLAERLSEAGNQVIVAGRRLDALRRISDESPEIETVALDVADPASVKAAAAEVVQRHPDLNILVAMAGIMLPEDLHTDGFLSTAEMTVATNLLGPIRLVAALTEHLAGRPEATIITVSSGLAFVPLPLTPTYSATKAAIHSFTQALRMQLSGTPVEVLELIPPAVQTSLMHQDETGQGVPLDVFLDEVMDLLAAGAADEILVKAVEPLRYAEVRGHYAAIFGELSHVGISACGRLARRRGMDGRWQPRARPRAPDLRRDDVTVPPAGQAGFAAQVRRLARSLYSAVPGERECSDVFTVSGSCPDGQRTAIEVPGDGYSPLYARRIRGTRS
jgi:uncharacterized oxidoreductase